MRRPGRFVSTPTALLAPQEGRLSRTAEALLRVAGWDTAGQDRIQDQQNQRVCQGRRGSCDSGVTPAPPRRPRRIRQARWAAPKPLSMFTTPTPEAQELSMARSAARPWKRGPVADARRHGDDRRVDEPGHHRGQRPLHPGHHDHDLGAADRLGAVEQPVEARDAHVVDALDASRRETRRDRGLLGDRQVGGAGRRDRDPAGQRLGGLALDRQAAGRLRGRRACGRIAATRA